MGPISFCPQKMGGLGPGTDGPVSCGQGIFSKLQEISVFQLKNKKHQTTTTTKLFCRQVVLVIANGHQQHPGNEGQQVGTLLPSHNQAFC